MGEVYAIMKIHWKLLALLAFATFIAWGLLSDVARVDATAENPAVEGSPPAEPVGSSAWRHDALWDDGLAEFCAYELDWARYGDSYPGRALLILVKEPWAPDLDVKADHPRPDGFEVLKLNHIRDVPTGIYTYHQMASVYFRRDSGKLQKIAATSSEACGVSTAQMTGGTLTAHSYFDGVGDQKLAYPEGALPYDGLPALLRDYVTGEAPAEVTVFAPLMDSRLANLTARTYALERQDGGSVQVPAGTFEVVELALERHEERFTFLFEAEAPHRLLKLVEPDGTTYRMSKCERIPYWRMSRPGDEEWLPEEVRG